MNLLKLFWGSITLLAFGFFLDGYSAYVHYQEDPVWLMAHEANPDIKLQMERYGAIGAFYVSAWSLREYVIYAIIGSSVCGTVLRDEFREYDYIERAIILFSLSLILIAVMKIGAGAWNFVLMVIAK